MRLTVREKPKKTVPPGFYHAICVGVWDLGTHYNETFKKSSRNLLLTWELPELLIDTDDGEMPMLISKRYNQSLSKKATLRKHLEAWLGRELSRDECETGLNLEILLGRNAYIQMLSKEGKDGNTYAKVENVLPLIPNMTVQEPVRELQFFSFEERTEIPEGIPDWIKKEIESSDEWTEEPQEMTQAAPKLEKASELTGEKGDEIPF